MPNVFTATEVLVSHANARLTVHGRVLLVERIMTKRRPVAHVAAELGVSRQCAHRWLRRFREKGLDGRVRGSNPGSCCAGVLGAHLGGCGLHQGPVSLLGAGLVGGCEDVSPKHQHGPPGLYTYLPGAGDGGEAA